MSISLHVNMFDFEFSQSWICKAEKRNFTQRCGYRDCAHGDCIVEFVTTSHMDMLPNFRCECDPGWSGDVFIFFYEKNLLLKQGRF